MANKTDNFGLTKPLPDEFYDVNVHNENMDIIDETLKTIPKYATDINATPIGMISEGYSLLDYDLEDGKTVESILDEIHANMGSYGTEYFTLDIYVPDTQALSLPNGLWFLQVYKGGHSECIVTATSYDFRNDKVSKMTRVSDGSGWWRSWKPENVITYSKTDLTAGVSTLKTGELYFVYE
jgi:hypothetical protein